MHPRFLCTVCCLLIGGALEAHAQKPWQMLQMPTVDEAAALWSDPPPEYAPTVTWGWDGPVSTETIRQDLDDLYRHGFRAVTIEAGYGMAAPYLSPGWFALVKTAVEEAAQRGMRVWIIDEGKYPSGFAGGRFSAERPDLRMRALVVADRFVVEGGEKVDRPVRPAALSAAAVNLSDSAAVSIPVRNGRIHWTAPPGRWEILVVEHQFRTSQTRAVNNPSGGKDTTNALMDYLNPDAVRQFIAWTHEEYKKAIGGDFGRTVLGFRGDEPDFARTPWTPSLPEVFEQRKGYDVRLFLASFFAPRLTPEQHRIRADYWEVWSDLFGSSFFDLQSEWAGRNGLEYLVHLNNEHRMMHLVRGEGDFFRPLRNVHIPGVDAIWNQVWPGAEANFVKLAPSAAHLAGRPRAFSESFAAYDPRPDVDTARWGINYQLARGINFFELMFYPSSAGKRGRPSGYLTAAATPDLAAYTHRSSYLLAQGRPMADVAVYFPTPSLWLGDESANDSVWAVARALLDDRREFDFIDDYALAESLMLSGSTLINRSGNAYRTVIIPAASVLSEAVLERLRTFHDAGGKVLFAGRYPEFVKERTFRNARPAPPMDWARLEPSAGALVAGLEGVPALSLNEPFAGLSYAHRRLTDGDLYFVFNETDRTFSRLISLEGSGSVSLWNADTGRIETLPNITADGSVILPVTLAPAESRFIVVGAAPANAESRAAIEPTGVRRFDFGVGPVEAGYEPVLPAMRYTPERGYGFIGSAEPAGVDRGGPDALRSDFITSDSPFFFTIDLPEGNYDVTLTLGDREETSETTVKAESRRLMLEGVATRPGLFETRTVTVNIRSSRIEGGGEVRLKPREIGAAHWDGRLTFEFTGSRPKVAALEIRPAPEAVTVFLAGNSTVTDQQNEPYAAWGQMAPRFFKQGIAVANHAESGETLKAFVGERRLEKVLSLIRPGDYLFIEFAHNDQKPGGAHVEPFTTYKEYLKRFIDAARDRGARPVLVTSMHRRSFDEHGRIVNTLGDYPEAMRRTAREENVPLIDLNALSKAFYEALGPETSKKAFIHHPAGVFPGQDAPLADDTHHSTYGAYQLAKMVLQAVKNQNLDMAAYLVDDWTPYDPARPDSPDAWNLPLSPSRDAQKPEGN